MSLFSGGDLEHRVLDDVNKAYDEAKASTLRYRVGIAIGIAIVCLLGYAYCSGKKAAHREDRHAAVEQVLQTNTVAIAKADTDAQAKHAGVAAAAKIATQAVQHAAAVRSSYTAARARVAITSDTTVAVDNAPPIAAPAPVVAVVRKADSTIAATDSALTARTAERDSLVGDTAAIAQQRDLYHVRADTLQSQLEQSSGECGKLCTIGKATVVTAIGVAVYNIGRQLFRHLFVGPAKVERSLVAAPFPHVSVAF